MSFQAFWYSACTITYIIEHYFVFFDGLLINLIDDIYSWSVLLDGPIINKVELKFAPIIEFSEQAYQVSIVWSLFKCHIAAIGHVGLHLAWISKAQLLNRCVYLTFFDLLVLL